MRFLLSTITLFVMLATMVEASVTWGGGGMNALASNPTNWVGGVAPVAGDAIVLDNTTNKNMTWNLTNLTVQSWTQVGYVGTVTVATVYGTTGFTNLCVIGDCIISNGVWTHNLNTGTVETNRLRATIGGNLIIGPNAAVDVSAKGYPLLKGPGRPPAGGTASYGGYGWQGGPCYGSIVAPTNCGSGGTESAGGGAILLTVGGMLRNDGLICADGGRSANYGSASGGSIWLIAGMMSGNGTDRAHGGQSVSVPARAAGGGRISLVVTNLDADFTSFSNKVTVYTTGDGGRAGTIYREKPADGPGKGELLVDNLGGGIDYSAGITALSGTEAVTCEFSRIILTNGAVLSIGSNDCLIATNTVLVGAGCVSNGIWVSGGTLLVPSVFVYSNLYIGISAASSTFSPAISVTIGTNAEFRVDKPHTMSGNVILAAGGKLTHTANPVGAAEVYKINLTVNGSLLVQAGGSVDVNERGFTDNYGPGSSINVNGGGGAYGGNGSNSGSCYGSIVAPTNLGSGGHLCWDARGAHGGGAIQLMVSEVVSNGGRITANATEQSYRTGSGGSVFITAGSLIGSGPIQANSATNVNASSGCPGGGGRIALVVTNTGADFSGYPSNMITAFGGKKTGGSGGAGTIYLRQAGQSLNAGTLIVDNNNMTGLTTEIGSNVTDAVVGDVILRNQGVLDLASNQTLSVSGIWSNAANLTAQWGSQILFAGGASSTSTVYGANTFMGLTCTNAGKVLLFQAGKTNSVAAFGRLTLKGSGTTNLILRSTQDSSTWKLNISGSAAQVIELVDVKDSDAMTGVGTEVLAMNSTNSGNNYNWRFITVGTGETNVWTGASNTVWSSSTNWSLGRSPVATDFIQIPTGRPRYPVLDAAATVNGIELQANASLTLAGFNLLVTTNAVVAGALIASDTETVSFQGDVDFSGGAFAAVRSTISLAGSGNQAVNFANLTFYKVLVLNSVGSVAFNSAFTATEFRCEAPGGTRNMTFLQGATVRLRDLVLLGSVASTNISLRSSSPGQKWNLAVLGYRWNVQGVDVQDSDASVGLPIPAISSRDGGNNANWVFNASRSVWLGVSNNNFHTAANWSPSGVPGASTRVLVNSSNSMTLTGAVTVLELTVGGGSGVATGTVNAALTVGENITVLSNGMLLLNRPCVVSNGLYVLGGGLLTHTTNTLTEVNKIDVTVCGDVGVDGNGSIDVSGMGYSTLNGPGYSPGTFLGGSYGGSAGGGCYGSVIAPTNLGSGGASDAGAGAIVMRIGGALRHDGLIDASGKTANGNGGGSGGSINLTSGTIIGAGTIRANGGDVPSSWEGRGGGGRLALVVTNTGADFSLFSGTIQARSGVYQPAASAGNSGAGTVYLRVAGQGPAAGTLIVDNANFSNTSVTEISSNVTEATVGNVLIRNAGYLSVNSNQNLVVSGIWSNGATFASQWGSQVIFAGAAASTSTVYGINSFMGLTCTNLGKTLLFQAGKTNTIPALGRLTLKGVGATKLMLRSTVNGSAWKLNVNVDADPTVQLVDVMDSDARSGALVTAINSLDSGNNSNWNFMEVVSGETNSWTGVSNTVWSFSTNWSLGRAPIADDYIKIPIAGTARYPVLDADRTVNGLAILSGASLSLAGYNLTVSQPALVAGAITAAASESITFQSDVDFTGAVVPAHSTIALAGGGDQIVNLGNLTFFKVDVLNSAGTVTFNNGFAATELRCEAPSGTRNLVFEQGATYTLRDLVLLGAVGGTNITLRSSSSPSTWNLAVRGYRNVRGVDVQDSDASTGFAILPSASQDSGNNPNWLFDVTPSMWLGVSNSNFHTAANWSPAGVPGATTRVMVDTANPMIVTGAVTVLEMTVGGGAAAATGTVNAALTVSENITVLSNGTLILNRPCVISNNLNVLAGGLLTHSANSTTESNKLNVTVFGDVGVDIQAAVDVTGKGYAPNQGLGITNGLMTGSYGGGGSYITTPNNGRWCYGSIIAPTNLGSGGYSDFGGGAIQMRVGGTIRQDGNIYANGAPGLYYRGSGGSIYLTAGALTGIGAIQAHGGDLLVTGHSAGGGGRIALVVTNMGADFSLFTGLISARSSMVFPSSASGGGAGTIYKQAAADRPGRGTVWVDNNGLSSSGYTDLPPYTNYVPGEVERVVFNVTNAAALRLASDFNLGDLALQSANSLMDLNFKTLILHSRQHVFLGAVTNYGVIIWIPDVSGTVFSVR